MALAAQSIVVVVVDGSARAERGVLRETSWEATGAATAVAVAKGTRSKEEMASRKPAAAARKRERRAGMMFGDWK